MISLFRLSIKDLQERIFYPILCMVGMGSSSYIIFSTDISDMDFLTDISDIYLYTGPY